MKALGIGLLALGGILLAKGMTKKEQHAWWKATHKEQARLEKIRLEGMMLFSKHFHSLWD
jgi:hypothetical protein